MQLVLVPPFTLVSAREKVTLADEAWNTRNAHKISLTYSEDSMWRYRDDFFQGRDAIRLFLQRKWQRECHYKLSKELWAFTGNRISVRFECEWQDIRNGCWYRTHGNEHWEFDKEGLIRRQDVSANDILILESQRKFK